MAGPESDRNFFDDITGRPGLRRTTSVGFRLKAVFTRASITTETQSCRHMQTMTQQDSMPFLIKNEQITSYGATDGEDNSRENPGYYRPNWLCFRAPRQSLKDSSWGGKIDKKKTKGESEARGEGWRLALGSESAIILVLSKVQAQNRAVCSTFKTNSFILV